MCRRSVSLFLMLILFVLFLPSPVRAEQLRSRPAAAGTVRAEADKAEKETDEAAMYAAYLSVLRRDEAAIRNYNWQMSDGDFHYPPGSEEAALRPVALTDIWGDAEPELIYVKAVNAYGTADLRIFGWKDGSLRDLCTFPQWDVAAASGTHYALFRMQGEKDLYAYSYIGDEIGFYHWYRFRGGDILAAEEAAYAELFWSINPDYTREDLFRVDNQDTDKAGYDARSAELLNGAETIVLFSASREGDPVISELFEKPMISMTLNEAVSRLSALSADASPAGGTFTLDALNGLSLVFASGAGGWDTTITMEAGGAFTGTYHDSDMGAGGDGYDATLYICPFSGRFSDLQQTSATVYTAAVSGLHYEYTPGDEWIEDMGGARVLHVAAEAYGLDDCSRVTIYLPGTPIADIPEDALFRHFYEGTTLDGVVICGNGDFYTSEAPAGLSAPAGAASPVLLEGLLFPDSDSRLLTEEDLASLSKEQIQTAVNEIYARHGYRFKDDAIRSYFERYSWYSPPDPDMDSVSSRFTAAEAANVDFLAKHL